MQLPPLNTLRFASLKLAGCLQQFKRLGVISQPEIAKFTVTPDDKFMVLACDGE
jgi:serine/threonine protein phosphatase PrpC